MMRLKSINFDIDTLIAQCLVEYTPFENTASTFNMNLSDAELTELNPNWWVAEVKQVLSIKLNTEVK